MAQQCRICGCLVQAGECEGHKVTEERFFMLLQDAINRNNAESIYWEIAGEFGA